jgi:hypothetical protein
MVYLKGSQNPLQEIVAELSAVAVCIIVAKKQTNSLGNPYCLPQSNVRNRKSIKHYYW